MQVEAGRVKRVAPDVAERCLFERTARRRYVELLAERVELLEGKDKAMMEMYLDGQTSCRRIARLLGRSEASIGRRIKKLLQQLADDAYPSCLRNCDMFSESELDVARDYFLRGVPMAEIARRAGRSYYCVRTTVKSIRRKIDSVNGRAAGGGRLTSEGGSPRW